MKEGETARVSCPSNLAWGSSVHSAPLDHSPIPANSDIDFYLEVVKCNSSPK
jgi:FKBP-type peptidyl-prolyl cis-trans isomerase